jgi:hypothetical protein
VEIVACRPRSALKRWELVKVLKKANPLSAEIVTETPAGT